MHVVLVSTFYYPTVHGGAEHTVQHLAESLVQQDVQVTVLSLRGAGAEERFVHHGVHCRALPVPNVAGVLGTPPQAGRAARIWWHLRDVYNPAAGRLLEQHLRDLRPDIVQTHNLPGWSCAAWTAARRTSAVHVQVLHDFQLTCPSTTRFRAGRNCTSTCGRCRPFASARRRLSQGVKHVVANSRYTRQVHRDLGFFARARVFDVIYGAVPPATPRSRPALVESADTMRVGYIGRLHPTKGIESLLTAFRRAGRADTVLRIAGTGTAEYEAELRRLTAEDAVEFLGRTAASDFFPGIDVLVVPSVWNEPMGRVVIEAATHGVPVIAAARGGIPELVQEGATGWLYDADEPAQLTRCLARLDRATLGRMRTACEEHGRRFAPVGIVSRWLDLYARLRQEASHVGRNS